METEFIIKIVTATVAGIGAVLGLFHFLTTKRSLGYQNTKTEIELLSQSIAAHEPESDLKKFLVQVRKERISFLVFGISISNAELERIIAYYRKTEGKVTAGEIAKAWQYRDPKAEQLSFQLRGSFKRQYIFTQIFMVFCFIAAAGGFFALVSKVDVKESILLMVVSLTAFFVIAGTSQDQFTAARLAKLEKERMEVLEDA